MIEDVRLECTDNGGFIVCYTEKVKPTGSEHCQMANYNYNYKKESFGPEEDTKALDRMKELVGKMKTEQDEKSGKVEIEVEVKNS